MSLRIEQKQFALAISLVGNVIVAFALAFRHCHRTNGPNVESLSRRAGDGNIGRVGILGDSQVAIAPLLELTSEWRAYGFSGATLKTLSHRAPEPKCERLIIFAGSNDCIRGTSVSESVAASIKLIALHTSHRPLIFISIPPLHGFTTAQRNDALCASVLGLGAEWLDLGELFGDFSWTDDGVHLNWQAWCMLFDELDRRLATLP